MLEAGQMGNHKDLSDFDKGQIVMVEWLSQSISKTARLVECSGVVSRLSTKSGLQRDDRWTHNRFSDACKERRLACVVQSQSRATLAQ